MAIEDDSLLPELKERFGLNEDPFSARLKVFFDGAQRRHNLETLRHLSIFGDMVLLLTGDHGAGKTTLIEQFAGNFADEVQVISLSAGTGSERISSIVRLAALSGMDISPKDPHRDVLEHLVDRFTEAFEKNGKRVLVIIDDAHALPHDELELYLQVMASLDAESGVALLLAGLPSLTASVSTYEHPDKEEWLHQVQLKPLNAMEVKEYVQCRLEAAGYVGSDVLSDQQLSQLVDLAQGNPGSVNDYFALVALGKTEGVAPARTGDHRVPHMALVSIAVLIAFSFLFVSYQHGFFDFEVADQDKVSGEQQSLNALKLKEERLAKIEQAIEQVSDAPMVVEEAPKMVVASSSEPEERGATNTQEVKLSAKSDQIEGEENKSALADISTEVSPVRNEGVADTISEPESTQAVSTVISKPKDQKEVEISPVAEAQRAEATKTDASKVSDAAKKDQGPPQSVKVKPYYQADKWVNAQQDSAYTAQILGSYNEQTAINFIKSNIGKAPELYYIESRYKGKPWYIVLLGSHPSKSEARKAVDTSVSSIRKQKPWLRSFKGIKDSLP